MKILLAIDDSKFARAALKTVIEQNRPSATRVLVLHAVEPMDTPYYPDLTAPYPNSMADIQKQRKKSSQALAARTVEQLRAAGFKASAQIVDDHARPAIVDAATRWHANLIVLGSHGRTGLDRVLLGSVSDYVSRHAPCSVEIVRMRKPTRRTHRTKEPAGVILV